MTDYPKIILDMLAADAAGVDQNLIKADAYHEVAEGATHDIVALADDLFARSDYPGSAKHVDHEMLTQLHLQIAETNALLRAILTALTAGKPAPSLSWDEPIPSSEELDLDRKLPDAVPVG
jgi:hypothetical protein